MLENLSCALDSLCAAEDRSLADGETVVALHRELERLKAVVARASAAFDATRAWDADGARSAAAWIATRCRLPMAAGRRRVRLGRALREMPATEEAWLAGDVGEAHVEPLAAVRRRVGGELFDPDETALVDQARTLHHRDFLRTLAYWVQLADPDRTEEDAEAQRGARRFHLSQSLEETWFADGLFDPISGEAVSRVLRAIENELFAADWAAARAELGEEVCASRLARTPAQRRADAVVEMARRAAAVPAGARLPEPLFTVLVGYETFAGRVCQLAGGTAVTPGSLLPWLTEAHVERVVFDGPDRVKNVGVRHRLFGGATRRSVEVRGQECYSEYCDIPADECEIDHVQPYSHDGLTVDDNGRPACRYHNRFRNRPP